MGLFLRSIIGILLCIIGILILKIAFLKKAANEIREGFEERLKIDTNTLIDISGNDSVMAGLANAINKELRLLRAERNRFQQGDIELKTAVTNISHDLRTPLTAIYGYIDLLGREELSDEAKYYLMQIKNRSDAMKQLTEELLKYSIIASEDEMKKESVNIGNVLEETIASFYGILKQRGITPKVKLSDTPVIRQLDKNATVRIFSNIVSNALKYSDGDFFVMLRENGEITFSNKAKNLDSVIAEKLFNRFYTVENAGNSTGLGLSIAKLLTERMGGSIKADYRDGTLYILVVFKEEKGI